MENKRRKDPDKEKGKKTAMGDRVSKKSSSAKHDIELDRRTRKDTLMACGFCELFRY